MFRTTAIALACIGLTACQTTTSAQPASADMIPVPPLEGTCTDPQSRRDNFYARVIQDPSLSSAEKIAEARAVIESRGGNPDESGSFAAFQVLVTGDTSILSQRQDVADYHACLTPLL